MSLPQTKRAISAPGALGGRLLSCPPSWDRGSDSRGCALGAHVTAGGDASAHVDSGRQSSAYLRPNPIAAIYDPLKNSSFWRLVMAVCCSGFILFAPTPKIIMPRSAA
jgi:hypothetical protein